MNVRPLRSQISKVRSGFTVLELCIVLGIIVVLMAMLLPAVERVRHRAYIDSCAANLRSIGQALAIYAEENHGNYPRTVFVPGAPISNGTGSTAADPFQVGGPAANDVSAAAYLLMRTEKMTPVVFNCPYNDVFTYVPETGDWQDRSNFMNLKINLGYSFADPYPDAVASGTGYQWTTKIGATFAMAADKNPGTDIPHDDVVDVTSVSTQSVVDHGNSNNHEQDGQNVLYGDGHVSWTTTCLCGDSGENIFTNQNGRLDSSPLNKSDSLLLPTDDQ